ncbi:MAG TPA: hypothetical protein VFN61_11450, partial [Acidimicrobiales bacterium]|nr:hypothetical protein [Acidimicrobiales bacterium]
FVPGRPFLAKPLAPQASNGTGKEYNNPVAPDDAVGTNSAPEPGAPKASAPRPGAPKTMYDRLGGMEFFERLTDHFYDGVERDEVLRALYPEDLAEPKQNLCLFLAQYFGGPRAYNDRRGNPQLRARHLPFTIGNDERDRWLAHMTAAVHQLKVSPLDEAQILTYFRAAANHMVNSLGPER